MKYSDRIPARAGVPRGVLVGLSKLVGGVGRTLRVVGISIVAN